MFSSFQIYFFIYFFAIQGVALQAFCSYWDDWLEQSQLPVGKIGFTFFQHGGMWSDVTLIPYIVAYMSDHYDLPYRSWLSVICLVASAIGWYVLVQQYREAGIVHPEAHTHDGHTTIAGWIHYVFAVIITWYVFLTVFGVPGNDISLNDVLILGIALSVFFPLGQWKFNSHWHWQNDLNFVQLGVLWAVTWVTLIGKHELWFRPVETWIRANLI